MYWYMYEICTHAWCSTVDDVSGDDDAAAKQQQQQNNERTVFISNLDFNKREPDVMELLSRAGEVKDIRLVKGARGRSKGFGYVEYKDEVRAAAAAAYTPRCCGLCCIGP